jgi:hypothetical protein
MALEKMKTAKTLDRWVDVFKTAFKGATVDVHSGRFDADELQRLSVKVPAIFVAALSALPGTDTGDNTLQGDTVFSAYILTGGQQRDVAGWNMQEVVRVLLHNTVSNIPGVARPKQITWGNILSTKTTGKQIALNAVAWRQNILIGEQSTDDIMFTGGTVWPDGVVPDSLYLSDESDESDGLELGYPNPPPA